MVTDTGKHSATLLLAHARTQKTNQQRLENYLAASTSPNLNLSQLNDTGDTTPRAHSRQRTLSPHKNGTDTPRDLNARVKILELYTLHVLLRNNEWDYAREFISVSSVLDEERREAFLQALQSLQDEQLENEKREREERIYQEEQTKRDVEEARRRRMEGEKSERETGKKKAGKGNGKGGSEVDYGVEEAMPKKRSVPSDSPTKRPGKKIISPRSETMLARAGIIISNLRQVVEGVAGSFKTRPLFVLQMLAFLVGFLVVVSRRDVKERVRRLVRDGWRRVRATAGMGVKVSYI